MYQLSKICRAVLATALIAGSMNAVADGTNSGVTVTNSVTMNYTVNSVNQSANTTVDFTVDSKLRLDVTTPQTDWVTAVPGQTQGGGTATSIQFLVTNNSNTSTDVVIAVIDQALQQVDGFSTVGSTAISPTTITVWEDTDGDGVLDGGENTLGAAAGSYALTGTLAEDEERTISVSIDVDGGADANEFHAYTLVAAVASGATPLGNDDSGNAAPSGTAAAVANGKDTVEIVFADSFAGSVLGDDEGYDFLAGSPGPTGADDGDGDGQASNASGFRTRIALGIAKHVEVLWDPISANRYDGAGAATTNVPKAIPGAILLYVIGIVADSGLDATSVLIDDDIPETLVDAGNTTGEAPASINMPATVDIDINGGTETFTLDAAVTANGQYHVQDCAGSAVSSTNFAAGPEVDDANLGACDDGDTGYVAYVVTVDDTVTP